MRNPDLDDQANDERRAYLTQHGWVASTSTMGGGLVQELQISLAQLNDSTRIAVAFFAMEGDSGHVVAWPGTVSPGDGCRNDRLVRGFVPPDLPFEPGDWATLALDP
jgi:hypothetical protein